jgi:hypothetical protein
MTAARAKAVIVALLIRLPVPLARRLAGLVRLIWPGFRGA